MSTVKVDFSQVIGPVKIMHSVNNGPAGTLRAALNNFEAFRKARIPYARTHDSAFYAGYGGEHTVDVHRVFKSFDADPTDPASYDFEQTDNYLQNMLSVGTKPFFRLGATIEHQKKVGAYPPKDFHKWAVICEHFIRHYNEGWADGFHMDIEYWEIWNEPDNGDVPNPCWLGTPEQFTELFVITVRHLKTCFPQLKIGGPALCSSWNAAFNEVFFSRLQKEKLPLDFFSFHGYAHEPQELVENSENAKKVLEKYGYGTGTELILNEWNYVRDWRGDAYVYSMRVQKELKGAAFIAAVMCAGQASPVDHLMYYDARPSSWNGMFSQTFFEPLKGYYPFLAWSGLYELGCCVQSASDDPAVYCAAAAGKNAAGKAAGAVLVTRYADVDKAPAEKLTLELTGLSADVPTRVQLSVLDDARDLQPVMALTVRGDAVLELELPMFTSCYLELSTQ